MSWTAVIVSQSGSSMAATVWSDAYLSQSGGWHCMFSFVAAEQAECSEGSRLCGGYLRFSASAVYGMLVMLLDIAAVRTALAEFQLNRHFTRLSFAGNSTERVRHRGGQRHPGSLKRYQLA